MTQTCIINGVKWTRDEQTGEWSWDVVDKDKAWDWAEAHYQEDMFHAMEDELVAGGELR